PNYSLTFTMVLACIEWGFSSAQALLAVTRNAARALGRGGEVGLLAPGKQADLVLWEAEDYRELSYYTGVRLARSVVKGGKVVWQN
ncbi:MAG: amidohydrolase family protein, partial [Candidatus Zixiibacteriota bacterium]